MFMVAYDVVIDNHNVFLINWYWLFIMTTANLYTKYHYLKMVILYEECCVLIQKSNTGEILVSELHVFCINSS